MDGGSDGVGREPGGFSTSLDGAVAELVDDGVVAFDADGRVADVNDALADATGFDRERLVGEPISTLLAGDRVTEVAALVRSLAADGESGEESLGVTLATADGDGRPVELRLRAVDGSAGGERDAERERRVVGVVSERDEHQQQARREREQELRRERDITEQVLSSSPVGIAVMGPDGTPERANQRMQDLLGLHEKPASEFSQDELTVYGEDGTRLDPSAFPSTRVFETGEPVYDWTGQVEHPDGERRWVTVNAVPLHDGGGESVERVVVTAKDVTDLKSAQRELARERDELESELSELLGRVTDAFLALDEDWNLTYVNERAAELLDREETDLLGANLWEEFGESPTERFRRQYERAMETQEPVSFEEYYEPLDTWFYVAAYPSESGLSVYFRDVTERKQHEQTLAGLHGVAQELPHAETKADVAERVVDAASDLLGLPGVTLYLHDDEADELYPAAYADDMLERYGELPRVAATADSSVTGTAFVDGDTVQYEDVTESELLVNDAAAVRRNLFVPLGDHGVLIVGDQEVGTFDEGLVDLAELLAADAESAMDRVERESELRERERELEQYESVVEQVDDGIYALDTDLRYELVNEAYADLFDLEPEDMLGRTVGDVLGDEFVDLSNDLLDALLASDGDHYSAEFSADAPDGDTIEAQGRFAALRDDDGDLRGTAGVVRDVTERKARERELERYETIVETVSDGIYVLDEDGRFTMVNDAQARMLGYETEALLGEDRSMVAPPETKRIGSDAEAELLAGETDGATVEAVVQNADGEEFPVETTLSLIEHDDGFERVGVVRDITERKRRERALEESERRYRTLAEQFPNGLVAMVDENLRFTVAGGEAFTEFGYDTSDVEGHLVQEVFEDDDIAERLADEYRATLDGQSRTFEVEYDGREWLVQAVPVQDDDGETFAGLVMAQDVSERKQRERELEQYETITERLDDGVYAIDPDGRFVMVNDAFCELTGYDRDELLGQPAEVVHSESVSDRASELAASVAAGDRNGAMLEFGLRTRDGDTIPVETRFGPYPYSDEQYGRCGVVRDVSERIEREQALRDRVRQQAVTAELGRLALEEPDIDELFREATRLVAETLDTDFCELLELDEGAGELLLRQGDGWMDGYVGSATVPTDEGSQAGYTLETEEPVVLEDMDAETRFTVPDLLADHDVASGMTVIVGSVDEPWGVLGAHDTETPEFSEHDASFLESVANVLATAVERSRRVAAIERQRQHLAALDNLNGVMQDINVALAESSTREEIERVVCERLVAAEEYALAWVGEVDRNSQTVTPSTWAGEGEAYLEDLTVSLDDSATAEGPTGRAVAEQSVQTTPSFEADDAMAPWEAAAAEHGFQSSAAIPLVYEGALYGVLNVYAKRPAAFEGREREVVAQLSEVVGHAIRAVERKEALMSESLVEIEFRSREIMEPLLSVTQDGGAIRFERTVQTGTGSYLQYVLVEDVAESAFCDVVERSDALSSPRLVTERSDGLLFELTLDDPPITSTVASHGGRVVRTVIADGVLETKAEVPHSVDIRTLVEALRAVVPDVEVVSQRSRQRDDETIRRSAMESLTDKQLAAVEAAFYAGYFEWPRESTAEELAESIGVAAPTLHQHLRKGEQKLLAGYFGG